MKTVEDAHSKGRKTMLFSYINRFLVFVLVAIIIGICVYMINHFDNFRLDNFKGTGYPIENWEIVVDGKLETETTLPKIYPVKDKLVMSCVLEKLAELTDENYVLQYKSNYTNIKAYINDEMVYSYPQKGNTELRLKRNTPQAVHFIPVASSSLGETLTIEVFPTGKDEDIKVFGGELTTKSNAIGQYMKKELLQFLIDSIIFCFGFALIVATILLRKRINSNMIFWLGMFLITYGIWDVTFVDCTMIFVPNQYLNYMISYMAYSFLPIPLMYFLFFVNKQRHRLFFNVILTFSILIAFITFALHITGVRDYQDMYVWVNMSVVSAGLSSLILILFDHFKYRDSGKYFLIGIVVFIALVLVDMSFYFFHERARIQGLMNFGLLCFAFCYLIDIVLMTIESIVLKRNYHLLEEAAYKDSLTQLENRRAFDKKVDQLEEDGACTTVYMVLFDANNLKQLNDSQGHQKGDEMLIELAFLLQKHFGYFGSVYRIGGDEFILLCEQVEIKQLQDALVDFNYNVNEKEDCIVNTSYGLAHWIDTDSSLYQVFNRAEEAMYRYKKSMKECVH